MNAVGIPLFVALLAVQATVAQDSATAAGNANIPGSDLVRVQDPDGSFRVAHVSATMAPLTPAAAALKQELGEVGQQILAQQSKIVGRMGLMNELEDARAAQQGDLDTMRREGPRELIGAAIKAAKAVPDEVVPVMGKALGTAGLVIESVYQAAQATVETTQGDGEQATLRMGDFVVDVATRETLPGTNKLRLPTANALGRLSRDLTTLANAKEIAGHLAAAVEGFRVRDQIRSPIDGIVHGQNQKLDDDRSELERLRARERDVRSRYERLQFEAYSHQQQQEAEAEVEAADESNRGSDRRDANRRPDSGQGPQAFTIENIGAYDSWHENSVEFLEFPGGSPSSGLRPTSRSFDGGAGGEVTSQAEGIDLSEFDAAFEQVLARSDDYWESKLASLPPMSDGDARAHLESQRQGSLDHLRDLGFSEQWVAMTAAFRPEISDQELASVKKARQQARIRTRRRQLDDARQIRDLQQRMRQELGRMRPPANDARLRAWVAKGVQLVQRSSRSVQAAQALTGQLRSHIAEGYRIGFVPPFVMDALRSALSP